MTRIALIVLDTLRKDTFGRHFDWVPGRTFTNAWSTSHWTVPAHASLFTGRYPSTVGVHARSIALDCEQPVLAERLRGAGYETVAFSANGNVVPSFDYNRGFDVFERHSRTRGTDCDVFPWGDHAAERDLSLPLAVTSGLVETVRGSYDVRPSLRAGIRRLRRRHGIGPGVVDDGASDALSLLRERSFDDDAFVFLNLMEAHTPYVPPGGYASRSYDAEETDLDLAMTLGDGPADPAPYEQAYEDCARYLADVYRDIHDELADFDYVITMSDHGEVFGTDGVWGHPHGLYPDLVEVPIVVRGPDADDGHCDALVSVADVYRTVLDAAGVDADGPGQSLLGEVDGRDHCRTEYHGLTHAEQRSSLLDQGFDETLVERYDSPLRGMVSADSYGYETRDGFTCRGTDCAETLRRRLEREGPSLDDLDRDGTDIDDAVEKRLEHLGYV
ncbi:sulfatase-like hydrolase/transferase [Natrinema ejinorense]|uniref:Arylsulfatase n=1 Tax=Natrinema ejinorense TaxID=373386 RepID=A0A2A5QPQ0_9EURY|nr:sulfatase-like hydrolase/transferase [Natrinema ejinorense]PCR88779.1 arylsulfatase [Natrinema ejinorense]